MVFKGIFCAADIEAKHIFSKGKYGKIRSKGLISPDISFPVPYNGNHILTVKNLRVYPCLKRNHKTLDIGPEMVNPASGSAKD